MIKPSMHPAPGRLLPQALARRSLLGGAVGIAAGALAPSTGRADPLERYPLDELPRSIPPRGRIVCPAVDLRTYEGSVLPYQAPARVYAGFVPHLGKLERLARDLAVEIYGRAPARLVHLGTYLCRRIAAYPDLLSEHGLGNAIDVQGFDFAPLGRGEALPPGVPSALRGGFGVRVARHWKEPPAAAAHTVAALHARFLRELARRLVARRDIFRVLLGPAYPGHHDHFHFDMAPYRLVMIFDEGDSDP
jgi:hypothetical protein